MVQLPIILITMFIHFLGGIREFNPKNIYNWSWSAWIIRLLIFKDVIGMIYDRVICWTSIFSNLEAKFHTFSLLLTFLHEFIPANSSHFVGWMKGNGRGKGWMLKSEGNEDERRPNPPNHPHALQIPTQLCPHFRPFCVDIWPHQLFHCREWGIWIWILAEQQREEKMEQTHIFWGILLPKFYLFKANISISIKLFFNLLKLY
jgi:hypothetical protein